MIPWQSGNPKKTGRYVAFIKLPTWDKPFRIMDAEWDGKKWSSLIDSAARQVTHHAEVNQPDE